MNKPANHKELSEVIALSCEERYNLFMKQLAEYGEIWLVGDDEGIATYEDNDGNALIPVWSDEAYAREYCEGALVGYTPESVLLEDWIEDWLPDLVEEGQMIAVFPTINDHGAIVDAEKFIEDLDAKLDTGGEG